jgi:hypothetical protein
VLGFAKKHCWDWLLLLAALLQHSSVWTKHMLMGERGSLLLELLYHVLLEDEGLGAAATIRGGVCLSEHLLFTREGGEASNEMLMEVDVPRVVLLVLHSLLCKVPEGLLDQPEGACLVMTSLGEKDS